MTPGADLSRLSNFLGTAPNKWGFFNTPEADPGKDIYVAGCAQGPKDILSAIQDGKIVSADILKDLDIGNRSLTIAVLGSGPGAEDLAGAIAGHGHRVLMFGRSDHLHQDVTVLEKAKIISIDGTMGNFSIFYQNHGENQTRICDAIVAAPRPETHPNTTTYTGAISLAAYTAIAPENRPDNSLILLDYYGPESKAQSRQALLAAMEARAAGRQADVLMNKMLVHGPEGQHLYDRARKSGIRFLRYESPSDVKMVNRDKGVEIFLKEATLPNMNLRLTPGTLVVPDTPAPSPKFAELARLLKLGLDLEGFLQPANIRHRLVQSQRRGIYFAGYGHDDIDENDLALEIRSILADLDTPPPISEGKVSINTDHCPRCLTCYRICPHSAVIIDKKHQPRIMENACFECQACVSNCPAYAIESQGLANTDLAQQTKRGQTLIFACERSAALAAGTLPSDTDLISIPCACRMSSDVILKALIEGADRVIVSGCHEGNCRSGQGGLIAQQGVNAVSALPGIPADKVVWQPVAANEPRTLARTISGN